MAGLNKIQFAFYLNGWSFDVGDKKYLRQNAEKILLENYLPEMKESLFCPECCGPVFKSPQEKNTATNGRRAYFAHLPSVKTDCGLRVKRVTGKKYINEEEALKCIENDELVVVNSFAKSKPEKVAVDGVSEFDSEYGEDRNGPVVSLPIGRHRGDYFNVPSKITTVVALCRSFDTNLHRYYTLPGEGVAKPLREHLKPIANIETVDSTPKLYIGKIVRSENMGKSDNNIRMTFLRYHRNEEYKDFCLKFRNGDSKEKGIDDDSVGRVVLVYGIVRESGVGLCIESIGWGEISLLPVKYEQYIDELIA